MTAFTSKDLFGPFAVLSLIFLIALIHPGCDQQSAGFALPAGDFSDGKLNFVGLNCNTCHSVADIEWEGIQDQDLHFRLGGETTRVKTYGELVTSIINPSHRIARDFRPQLEKNENSPMPSYNEVMTVQELVDLVTFLEKQYKLVAPNSEYYNW